MKPLLLTIGLLAISACVQSPASVSSSLADGPNITTQQAVESFIEACVKTYPRFEKADDRASVIKDELKKLNPAKSIYLRSFTRNIDGRRGCALSYRSAEPVWIVKAGLAQLGPVTPVSPFNAVVPLRDTSALIEIWINNERTGGLIEARFELVAE